MSTSLWSRVSGLFGSKVTAPPVAVSKRVRNVDGFVNEVLGIGTSRDKIAYGFFQAEAPIADSELSAAFYHNDIARKIVAKLPEEMFRRGWELEGEGAEETEKLGTDLGIESALFKALVWARLFGGAAVILGVDDGRMPWEPLVPERSRGIKFLNVIDRRRLTPWATYQNPLEPKYGEVSLYLVQPDTFGRGPTETAAPSAIVHESRLIKFDGDDLIDLQQRVRLNGWSYSVLQAAYRIIQQFATAFEAAGFLVSDASQGVFKMQGLIDMIAGGEEGTLQTRMALVDLMRHAGRAIMLDAEGEDFTRVSTPLAGVPELLDRLMLRLASAADMPVSILFGREPAGLNATGDADTRAWYAAVASKQAKILGPALTRFYAVATGGKWKGEIEFCPLWEPTDKEKAEIEKLEAETDKLLIDSGILFAEQVTLKKYGETEIEETIDVEALKASLKAEYELAAEGPKDPMAVPPGGAPPKPGAPPAAPKADAAPPPPPEVPFAQRNAAFLADLKDHKDLGLRADMQLLAKLHGVPCPSNVRCDQCGGYSEDGGKCCDSFHEDAVNKLGTKPFIATTYGNSDHPVLTVHPEDNPGKRTWVRARTRKGEIVQHMAAGLTRAPGPLVQAAKEAHAAGDTEGAKLAAHAATDPGVLSEAAQYHEKRGQHSEASAAKAGPSEQDRDELGRFA